MHPLFRSRIVVQQYLLAMYVVCRALIVDGTGGNPRSRWSFRHRVGSVAISDQFAMPEAKAFRKRPDSNG